MAKLGKIGLSVGTINWFVSYLNQTQVLTYDEPTSDCVPVRSGIGQGTIVGPIIFLIYITDIIAALPDVRINIYADDCILYYTGNN